MMKIFHPKLTIDTYKDVKKSTSKKLSHIHEKFAKHIHLNNLMSIIFDTYI